MTKEDILKGATKYIEQFKNKLFVIKYGGSLLDNKEISGSILDDIICLYQNSIKVVLVHGGGSSINRLMEEKGKVPKFVGGLRVTDEETARIVDEALTEINLGLSERLRSKGVKAESLVSREKLTIKAKKKQNSVFGDFVGEVDSVDTRYIEEAIGEEAIAVVSPVGIGEGDTPYNINADLAAAEVAAALSSEKFIILTDVKGVMAKKGDDSSLISSIKEVQARRLMEAGIIDRGMIPKVEAGLLALDKGVNKVHIISGRISRSLLIEVFTDRGIGTEIVR